MSKESISQDFQRAVSSNRVKYGGALLAAGAIAVAGVSSCNNESSSFDNSTTPDTSHTLTLEDMGADAGTIVPKIFPCPVECLSPEDIEKIPDDVERQLINEGRIPPKIFRCDVGCVGPDSEPSSANY